MGWGLYNLEIDGLTNMITASISWSYKILYIHVAYLLNLVKTHLNINIMDRFDTLLQHCYKFFKWWVFTFIYTWWDYTPIHYKKIKMGLDDETPISFLV